MSDRGGRNRATARRRNTVQGRGKKHGEEPLVTLVACGSTERKEEVEDDVDSPE